MIWKVILVSLFSKKDSSFMLSMPFFKTIEAAARMCYIYKKCCQKVRGSCAFPQNFHTRTLGEITVFYAGNEFDFDL